MNPTRQRGRRTETALTASLVLTAIALGIGQLLDRIVERNAAAGGTPPAAAGGTPPAAAGGTPPADGQNVDQSLSLPGIGTILTVVAGFGLPFYAFSLFVVKRELETASTAKLDPATAWYAATLVPKPTAALHAALALTAPSSLIIAAYALVVLAGTLGLNMGVGKYLLHPVR